jgi:pseudo-rSAM protein
MKNKLILYPSTFLWFKRDKGLLYNSETYKLSEFIVSPSVAKLCNVLSKSDNLYSVVIDDMYLDEFEKKFICIITSTHYGTLVKINDNVISYMPLLSIQNGQPKLSYLSSITFYIGGTCLKTDYYKQTIFPISTTQYLNTDDAVLFVKMFYRSCNIKINLVISDINDSKCLNKILEAFYFMKEDVVLYTLADDVVSTRLIKKAIHLGYVFHFVFLGSTLKSDIVNRLKNIGSFNILIFNEDEYSITKNIMLSAHISKYNVIPIFRNNIKFFKEDVYMDNKSIMAIKLSKREVFAHQSINLNFFGDMFVMPDGSVYSNVNMQPIGTIKNSIYQLITNALKKQQAWLLIRNKGRCRQCVYQWLCPSPSNYELVTHKCNLCNIVEAEKLK